MSDNRMSIQRKVYLALGTIFLVVMVVVISIAVSSERQLSHQMVHTQLKDKASGYLDTMNMLMISGAIGNRELLREKILADHSIIEARMMRSDKIDRIYGRGLDHEYPQDELDRRAMNGEEAFVERDDENGHTISFVRPVIAEENYRGTNCLLCHQAKQGDILGAIRITYDLSKLDEEIHSNMLTMASTQAAMFIAALALLTFMLRRVVLKPIRAVNRTIANIERDSDLTQRVKVFTRDEVGRAAEALNTMTTRFSDSLKEVVQTADQLEDASQHIERSALLSRDAAEQQNNETSQIQDAIEQLHASINSVRNNAEQSTHASQEAKLVAKDGVSKTDQAAATIESMNIAIKSTADVITDLNDRTTTVGGVLEVIKGIAEQTNLLALNAAIEAARAGESGRGFAVVADEVRTLSQRTQESAQEIEAMIEQLQQEAGKAVNSMQNAQATADEGLTRVNEAAAALHSMSQHVEQMDQMNTETVAQLQEQVQYGEDVSRGIHTISGHSQKTVENAEETTRVSTNLVSLANSLTTLVKRFKL